MNLFQACSDAPNMRSSEIHLKNVKKFWVKVQQFCRDANNCGFYSFTSSFIGFSKGGRVFGPQIFHSGGLHCDSIREKTLLVKFFSSNILSLAHPLLFLPSWWLISIRPKSLEAFLDNYHLTKAVPFYLEIGPPKF